MIMELKQLFPAVKLDRHAPLWSGVPKAIRYLLSVKSAVVDEKTSLEGRESVHYEKHCFLVLHRSPQRNTLY